MSLSSVTAMEQSQIKTEAPDNAATLESKHGNTEQGEQTDNEALPHQEAMKRVHDTITELIRTDPLLKDLPTGVTLEEVNSALAVEYGQAMVVNILRADGETMKVTVVQDATVQELKHAIRRHVTLKQSRRGGPTHISWRYIWRTYWLYYNGLKLADGNTLKSYGIRNKDEITFLRKFKQK